MGRTIKFQFLRYFLLSSNLINCFSIYQRSEEVSKVMKYDRRWRQQGIFNFMFYIIWPSLTSSSTTTTTTTTTTTHHEQKNFNNYYLEVNSDKKIHLKKYLCINSINILQSLFLFQYRRDHAASNIIKVALAACP